MLPSVSHMALCSKATINFSEYWTQDVNLILLGVILYWEAYSSNEFIYFHFCLVHCFYE